MEIDRLLAHLVPGAEGIVADDVKLPVDGKLDIMLDAGPAFRIERCLRIIVADDQVFGAVELGEERLDFVGWAAGEIAEMPDLVIRRDDGIPIGDQGRVVLGHIGEGATVDAEDARIGEMIVAGEPEHQRLRL